MIYTGNHEDFEPVFFASTDCNFCYAVADFNRIGMDDADYVHDEILVKIWH